jgi:hypothetical protein
MKNCVWVREVAVLSDASRWGKSEIAYWEVWSAHNTRKDASDEMARDFKKRPRWVSAKFQRATNRIRKYVPEVR